MKYVVLIADICESKALEDRAAIQERLASAFAGLNQRRVKFGLVSPFTFTPTPTPTITPSISPSSIEGSEIQAVFRSANELWTSIFELEFAMFPVRLCYGIGVGEMITAVNQESAIGMDGEAFDFARESIEGLKKDGKHFRVQGLAERDALVLHMLDLISSMRNSWRVARVGTFLGMLKNQTVAESVGILGISEQAVYRNIRDGELGAIQGFLLELSQLINEATR